MDPAFLQADQRPPLPSSIHPVVSEDTGQVPQGETSLGLGQFSHGRTSLGPGFPLEFPAMSMVVAGDVALEGSPRACGQSEIRTGRQNCALCPSSSLSPVEWPIFLCAAPNCLLFPAGCHQEHGASSHRRARSLPHAPPPNGSWFLGASYGQPRVKRAPCAVVAMSQSCECPQSSQHGRLSSERPLRELRS